MNPTEIYSAVAFYGFSPSPKMAENLYNCIIEIFDQLGHPPDKIGVGAPGFGDQLISFSRGSAKLTRQGFSNIQHIDLCSTLPDAKILSSDCYCSVCFSIKDSYVILVAQESLARLSGDSLLPLAKNLIEFIKPCYGIGYYRERQYGPDVYALGINQGGPLIAPSEVQEQKRHISRWCDTGMVEEVYHQGLIRDVYPWNFLTAPQLERPVNGAPLQDWIQADSSRGKLSCITDAVMLWEVEDAQAPAIRSVLWDAGIIFDWRKFNEDEPSERLSPEESLRRVLEDAQSKGVDLSDLQVLRGGSGAEVPTAELKKLLKKPRRSKK